VDPPIAAAVSISPRSAPLSIARPEMPSILRWTWIPSERDCFGSNCGLGFVRCRRFGKHHDNA
jgi:hypothetical protein